MTAANTLGMDQDLITIKMCNETFSAIKLLLGNSSIYFNDLFNPKKNLQPNDGVYHVYGKANLFSHILHFCHGHQYPLLFSTDSGFDVVGYHELLGESIRFGVQKLSEWIENEKYKDAVTRCIKVQRVEVEENGFANVLGPFRQETRISLHPFSWIEKRYQCPRGIFVHHGQPDKCGKDCKKKIPESGPIFGDMPNHEIILVKHTITINHQLLMPVLLPLSKIDWPIKELA